MTRPVVTTDPAVRFGRPHMRGIGPEFVAGAHWVDEDAADEYGLTRPELLVCCWFMAVHGEPRWRRRWKAWADRWSGALAREEYDLIPDPPTKESP